MFLVIEHIQSGETLHLRRLSPTESLCLEHHTDRWLEVNYDGELERAPADGHIPNGCGEYRTEIRNRKHDDVCIWSSLDWFSRLPV